MDHRTTLEKLQQSYGHEFEPPMIEQDQMALLFAYRRVLAELLVRDQVIERLKEHNKSLDLLLQQWIMDNPIRNKDHGPSTSLRTEE